MPFPLGMLLLSCTQNANSRAQKEKIDLRFPEVLILRYNFQQVYLFFYLT